MPLDPQARAWLDAGRASGMRPYQELGVEAARRLVDANAVDLFGALEEVARVEDVDLDGVPGRVYEPVGAGPGALVWLHGGGWAIGSLESHDPLCRALAARSGCHGRRRRLPPRPRASASGRARGRVDGDEVGRAARSAPLSSEVTAPVAIWQPSSR